METRILAIFTRTPLHVGAGNSVGAVDSPIMRERHTRIPVIPGSSLKGVLRDEFPKTERTWLFGSDDQKNPSAGALLIGEARVLAFPVRSAKGAFAWITCPLVLNRFKRDAVLPDDFKFGDISGDQSCLAVDSLCTSGKIVLEEYALSVEGSPSDAVIAKLKSLLSDPVWCALDKHLAVVSDGMFSHFVEQACEVVTRTRIDDVTGTVASGALFNQEQVPSETLFYSGIKSKSERTKQEQKRDAKAAIGMLESRLEESPVIQIGGDETIGLGFCSLKLTAPGE